MAEVIDFVRERFDRSAEAQAIRGEAAMRDIEMYEQAASAGGYGIQIVTEGHWLVTKNGRPIVQYWPGADKWQSVKTGKTKKGPPEKFREVLARGVL